ncbi:MAG TPA: DUF4112 domain-containing protein [Gemmatimonadaceae bacterium]|jgi:hypothetical protein
MTDTVYLERVARVRSVARILDTALRIPGTDIRFGLDSILGLVPALGDVSGAVLSGYIIIASARLGVPPAVVVRMILNVAVDTGLGAVPLIGDVFDVAWRANIRNAELLEKHAALPEATTRSSRVIVAAAVAALVLLGIGAVAFSVVVFRALAHLAT